MRSVIVRPIMPLIDTELARQEAVDDIHAEASTEALEALEAAIPFHKVVSLQALSAATPNEILADAAIPTGRKVYVTHFHFKVNGATAWSGGTLTTVKIQDSNGTPVVFATVAVAALTANALLVLNTTNVTLGSAFSIGSGGTASKGLVLVGDNNAGAGSDLYLSISGFIK